MRARLLLLRVICCIEDSEKGAKMRLFASPFDRAIERGSVRRGEAIGVDFRVALGDGLCQPLKSRGGLEADLGAEQSGHQAGSQGAHGY